jgi:hypothetical protein
MILVLLPVWSVKTYPGIITDTRNPCQLWYCGFPFSFNNFHFHLTCWLPREIKIMFISSQEKLMLKGFTASNQFYGHDSLRTDINEYIVQVLMLSGVFNANWLARSWHMYPRTARWRWIWLIVLFQVKCENFSYVWESHHYRWRLHNSAIFSVLWDLKQGVVPHLLWHGASVFGVLSNATSQLLLTPSKVYWVHHPRYYEYFLRVIVDVTG